MAWIDKKQRSDGGVSARARGLIVISAQLGPGVVVRLDPREEEVHQLD